MTKFDFYWNFIERPKRIVWGWIRRIFRIDNTWSIQHKVNRHRNELVLDAPNRIVRLLGWTDQYDDDLFYVIQDGNEIKLSSCVGGFVWLQNRLSRFDYYHTLHIWGLSYLPLTGAIERAERRGIILK